MFISAPYIPHVYDVMLSKNESRKLGFIYPAYYGVDQDKYYYYIIAHMTSGGLVVFFTFISCDTIYMNIVQHACGLLLISGHRFKWAIEEMGGNNEKLNPTMLEGIHRRVCQSVKAHQHAINYIERIEEMHHTYLFIVVLVVVLAFSITLLRASMMDPCVEFYKDCVFLVVQLVHLLFLAIQGHFVTVSHDQVYDSMYDAVWYNSTPRTQTLYMLALRRTLTPPLLTAGGLISLNLETFSKILKTSVSWFTVIKSTVKPED
ncbi:PREDICTED: odorant receptor 2a-like [Habropoda laboriosa]|uniref:odorant receptor 2a-like n=1 Tax=Habropoda laboriosa TaxID=597456 RepID=UPI00083D36FC|nr:PREDICTED: odorant receptor 2a-like [Habropoda laboriosa]